MASKLTIFTLLVYWCLKKTNESEVKFPLKNSKHYNSLQIVISHVKVTMWFIYYFGNNLIDSEILGQPIITTESTWIFVKVSIGKKIRIYPSNPS